MSYFQDESNKEYFSVLSFGKDSVTLSSSSTPDHNSTSNTGNMESPGSIKQSLSLVDPSNVFLLNNDILNNLNAYEAKYSRYLRCQNDQLAKNVTPACDQYGADGYASLEQSYANLISSIDVVANTIPEQTTKHAVSPNEYNKTEKDIKSTYKDILRLRRDLDQKLQNLYNEYNANPESVQAQLNSGIYANTLWTILASCLLYYIFVELT